MAKSFKIKFFFSLVAGLLITIAMYLLSNQSYPISTENLTLKKWLAKTDNNDAYPTVPKDLLFINTSYDRELVPISDDYGFPLGNTDITDRGKLVKLLQLLKESDNYKYVLLDIRFERGLRSANDSALWSLISSMPRLVVPYHSDMESESEEIQDKFAYADYMTTVKEGDFTKYTLFYSDMPSMALRVYQELTGENFTSVGGFFFSNGRLMRRSMMLNLAVNPFTEYDDEGYRNIYHLGENILKDTVSSKSLFSDRFIIVGDFTGSADQHSTYKGPMAGPAIHANALKDLLARHHLISWWTILSLWIFFAALFLVILVNPTLDKFWKSKFKRPKFIPLKLWILCRFIFQFFLSFIGYGTLLTAMFFVLYYVTGQIYEIIFLSIIFVFTSFFIKFSYK